MTAGRREWIGLALLAVAGVLIVMDLSVLVLALPEPSADLDPSATELLWITDIYGFLIAGTLLTMGTLGDRIGRRRLLLLGSVALVAGLSVLETGLWIVPSAVAVGAASNVGPLLARRFAPRLVVAGGLVLMVVGFGMMAQLDAGSPLAQLIVASVLIHLGIGPGLPLLTEIVVGAAPPERAGAASALNHTGNELGGALGLGLLGTLATAVYRHDTGGEAGAFGAPGRIAEDAFAHAFQVTALASAALVAAALALALAVLRRPAPAPAPSVA